MAELSREFDFPERYEREKSTRVMPEDLKKMGFYTLRMLMPPKSEFFAAEFATVVTDVERKGDLHDVTYALKRNSDSRTEFLGSIFNANGFMIIYNDGAFPNHPDEIEMAYFVGSLDPFDLALAELAAEVEQLNNA